MAQPNPPPPPLPTPPLPLPLPEDIRLKCSYYAAEIKTQVSSLYEEHHKWLEDHLVEIKDTMVRATQKKAGTRAVIAGIIKTPARKRTKRPSKKTSKPDLHPYPLAELKRSQLNIDSAEIQQIIQQQLQREKLEIESRLQQEISSLNHQYESPVKKSSNATPQADLGNQSPTSRWMPTVSTKSTATSSLSGPFTTALFPMLLPNLMIKQTVHPEPTTHKSPDQPPPQPDIQHEQAPTVVGRPSSSSADHLDVGDAFAIAGHELSAIQEGEEEDDAHLPAPIPGSILPQKVIQVQDETVVPPSQPDPQPMSIEKPSNSPERSPRPAFSPESSLAPETNSADAAAFNSDPVAQKVIQVQDETVVPPSQPDPQPMSIEKPSNSPKRSPRPAFPPKSSLAPETNSADAAAFNSDPAAQKVIQVQDETVVPPSQPDPQPMSIEKPSNSPKRSPRPAFPPKSSLAPETNSADAAAFNSDPVAPQTLRSSEPPLNTFSPVVTSHAKPKLDAAVSDSRVPTSELVDVYPSQSHPITYPFSLLPSALVASASEVPAAIKPPASEANNAVASTTPAVIQSPHSKWSSKPSGALWTQYKPLKTPASTSNLRTIGPQTILRSGVSGSPTEDLPKPFSLLSTLQSATVGQALASDAPMTSALTQSISLIDSQEPRRKRTSTDAGFSHTSDAHEPKMSRSHTPGLMNIRSSTTGGTARKGMEDLKSRLSKIQRESAMHERAHHHTPALVNDVPINANQTPSLVAHNNIVPSFPKAAPLSNSLAPLVPVPTPATLLTNSATRTSASNIVTTFETKKNEQLTTQVQPPPSMDNAPIQPTAKVESKHLAFLKGVSSTVNAPTSSVPILDPAPVKSIDIEVMEPLSSDRKATRKEERRLLAAEKKQAEEKAKAANEKRAKLAEAEKKKQEQEEPSKPRTGLKSKVFSKVFSNQSGTRQISTTEEVAKKRKMENESTRFIEKKVKAPQQTDNYNATKLPSSAQKSTSSYLPTRTAPMAPGSAMKATGSKHPTGSTSTIKQLIQQHKANPPSRPPSQASQYNGGINGKASHLKLSQASQSVTATTSTSTSANTMGKNKVMKSKKTVEKEEYIELPDIDSEYSDDDESEHERKEAKLPDWAQSPALREALANQRKVNPDDVFGGSIPPPRMEEIFRDRASKFRHRTSSANWTGADGLTALEEAEYAKRMGYHQKK